MKSFTPTYKLKYTWQLGTQTNTAVQATLHDRKKKKRDRKKHTCDVKGRDVACTQACNERTSAFHTHFFLSGLAMSSIHDTKQVSVLIRASQNEGEKKIIKKTYRRLKIKTTHAPELANKLKNISYLYILQIIAWK